MRPLRKEPNYLIYYIYTTSKWNWAGHAARTTDNWVNEVLSWAPIGKRYRGRLIIR